MTKRGTLLAGIILGIVAASGWIAPGRKVAAQSSPVIQVATASGSSCGVGGSFGTQCFIHFNWPSSFADANYVVTCTAVVMDPSDYNQDSIASYDLTVPNDSTNRTASAATLIVRELAGYGPGIQITTFNCIGVHP
jgi:hypothetical protein